MTQGGIGRESVIQAGIVTRLERMEGVWIVKYPGGTHGKGGTPDLLICVRGRFVGLEVKREGGKVSEIQKYQGEKIRSAGGIFEVVYSVEQAVKVVERVMEGRQE
jgi:hypothetical protein